MEQQDKTSYTILFVMVFLSLFVPYGLNGENYIYWFFSRVLLETGQFIVMGRSPLYTIYLMFFTWMGYPTSIIMEYLVTALITMATFYIFFRHFVSSAISLLISIIWMPYLLFYSTPQVQMLALSSALIAMLFRLNGEHRKNIVLFYTFMLLAYLFRPTYQYMILLFLVHDIWFLLKRKILISKPFIFKPKLSDIPLVAAITLMICFKIFQSDHRWNNADGSDQTWAPYNSTKSLASHNLLSSWSWKYVENKYGSNKGRDYHFTHKELFGDANSPLEAFVANPSFVYNHISRNIETFVSMVISTLSINFAIVMIAIIPILLNFYDLLINTKPLSRLTGYFLVGCILFAIVSGIIFHFKLNYFPRAFALAAILYGSFRFCNRNTILEMFTFSSFVLILLTIISIPKNRYMIPFLPMIITSAIWYGGQAKLFFEKYIEKPRKLSKLLGSIGLLLIVLELISNLLIKGTIQPSRTIILFGIIFILISSSILVLTGYFGSKEFLNKLFSRFRIIILPFFLVVFSSIYVLWPTVLSITFKNIFLSEKIRIHSYINDSLRDPYNEIHSLIKDCNGIMAYENIFLGAFMDVDLDKLYDVLEIPPFGNYGNSEYDGLNIERIDCLFISNVLDGPGPPGWYYNEKMRYTNYILPYLDELILLGAQELIIPNYGKAIIFPHE